MIEKKRQGESDNRMCQHGIVNKLLCEVTLLEKAYVYDTAAQFFFFLILGASVWGWEGGRKEIYSFIVSIFLLP